MWKICLIWYFNCHVKKSLQNVVYSDIDFGRNNRFEYSYQITFSVLCHFGAVSFLSYGKIEKRPLQWEAIKNCFWYKGDNKRP